MSTREDIAEENLAWYKRSYSPGVNVKETLSEIKNFAFRTFDQLDTDNNGFVSREELQKALIEASLDWREKSYISFLLRRIEDISSAYTEEWESTGEGISKADIQEYFKSFNNI